LTLPFGGKLDKSDCWRDPDGMEVEDFGQSDNLMMTSAVIDVAADFESAVKLLKTVIAGTDKHGVSWE
jgi:nucleoside 2-deoxyribosyltransferase